MQQPPQFSQQVLERHQPREKVRKKICEGEPIEDIEIIPGPEQGSPPVDLASEFAELNAESAPVMQEGIYLVSLEKNDTTRTRPLLNLKADSAV